MNYFYNLFFSPTPFKLAHELKVKKKQNETFGVFMDYYKFGNVFLLPEPVKRKSSSLGQELYYGEQYVNECEYWLKLKRRRHTWLHEHRKLCSKEFEEKLMNKIKLHVKNNSILGYNRVLLDSECCYGDSLLYSFWPYRRFVKNKDIINVIVKPHLKEHSLRLRYQSCRYSANTDCFCDSKGYDTFLEYCH